MLSSSELQKIQTPRQLLGDELFSDLQNLLISIHRRGGTPVMTNENPCLIFNGNSEGVVGKINKALTTVL